MTCCERAVLAHQFFKKHPFVSIALAAPVCASVCCAVKGVLLTCAATSTMMKIAGMALVMASSYAFCGSLLLANSEIVFPSPHLTNRDLLRIPVAMWLTPIWCCLNMPPYHQTSPMPSVIHLKKSAEELKKEELDEKD